MKFYRSTLNLPSKRAFIAKNAAKLGQKGAEKVWDDMQLDEIYVSDCGTYQVNLDKDPVHGFRGMRVWHLSIKRRDRGILHDWRILQDIKTAICGAEVEALEIYPAESRVVDTANQYHLFAFPDGEHIPCGWVKGYRTDNPGGGAVNRPGSQKVESPEDESTGPSGSA